MKSLLLLCLAAALVFGSPATDLTGKWAGSFTISGPNGETNDSTAVLILKQDGTTITGTVGPDENDRFPIVKGTLDGDKIILEANHGDGAILRFDLMLVSGRIKGKAELTVNGQVLKAVVDVARTP